MSPVTKAPSRRATLARLAATLALPAASTRLHAAAALPDVALVNHDGRRARLVGEIWRDRVALINFVFTSCSSFCGVQSAVAADVQQRLGDRVGREVVLLSISVDPLSDDPARLSAYAKPFAPGPHWWWLTGEPREVYRALDALGAAPGNARDHAPMWVVGRANDPRRIVGLAGAPELERLLLARLAPP